MTVSMDAPRDIGTTPAAERIRVLLADDDPLVRRILRDTLQDAGFAIVAEAGTGREAVELALHYEPDLMVVDLGMPEGDGIEVVRRVMAGLAPDVQVQAVVLTSRDDDETALEALQAGAVGYLLKETALEGLPAALRAAARGEAAISRRLSRHLIDHLRRLPQGQIGLRPVRSALTPREWEVLDKLCEGRSTEEIADEMVLATETVRSHIKNVLRKLGVGSRAEAIALAPRLRTQAG
jgi:NarL family two-component system response regulator LiaR